MPCWSGTSGVASTAATGGGWRFTTSSAWPITRRLAFDPSNCLTLCRTCHTTETNRELGNAPNPERQKWRVAVADLATSKPSSKGVTNA